MAIVNDFNGLYPARLVAPAQAVYNPIVCGKRQGPRSEEHRPTALAARSVVRDSTVNRIGSGARYRFLQIRNTPLGERFKFLVCARPDGPLRYKFRGVSNRLC